MFAIYPVLRSTYIFYCDETSKNRTLNHVFIIRNLNNVPQIVYIVIVMFDFKLISLSKIHDVP